MGQTLLRRATLRGIALLSITLFLCNIMFVAQATEQPSIVVLCGLGAGLQRDESIRLLDATYHIFQDSGLLKPIWVDTEKICWPTVFEAVKFSRYLKADYVLYLDLSKSGSFYSYDADLIDPTKGMEVASFMDKWKAEPKATEKAISSLSSSVIFATLGKITVNLTIISAPPFCDVYRGEYRIGNTGKNGFRKTLYWERGSYQIKLCEPGYLDEEETLLVEKNPTNYSRRFELRKE